MSSPLSQYSENMDWLRKEFEFDDLTSLYEIVNRLVAEYKALKNNQTTKEPEDGTSDKREVGRPRKTVD